MSAVSVRGLRPHMAECGSDGLSLLPEKHTSEIMRQN